MFFCYLAPLVLAAPFSFSSSAFSWLFFNFSSCAFTTFEVSTFLLYESSPPKFTVFPAETST